ncbi:CheR family methyltransferase [Bacillus suaedae]|uniref:PAS domain-containing protein n=1 Tax=Halalkalibacter suaedae TaxID=2822140 RepID=A0A941AM71_9BACI|nr:CheR family methyltransferase [Bacillus suaedae]MBP3949601.1 PAS domain-containing protein [Bacillus suaedae]
MSLLEKDQQEVQKLDERIHVVGIGASAGSLEALEHLFEHVSTDSGMAYVVVQHLSPKFKSYMDELLAKKTKLSIQHIENGTKLSANQIYLARPRTLIELDGEYFKVKELKEQKSLTYPIDHFFTSLAKERREKSIAVVLSGKGNDGSLGIVNVYESGGTVIAQQASSAKFDEMPVHAIETGKVDYVDTPKNMSSIFEKVSQVQKEQLHFSNEEATDQVIEQICSFIQRKSGINFTSYKRATILRRIEKRIQVNQFPFYRLEDYKEYLIDHPEEIVSLQKDLLINVTEFFRDQAAFEVIATQVIPALINQKIEQREHDLRVWIAGCSTGEEAYSIAILIREYLDKVNEHFNVKIFATDLDRDAIATASTGSYGDQAIVGVSEERIMRFFDYDGATYHVKKEIRQMIIFAPHNIAKDSPFVNVDLVTCRNMLIYFQTDLQQKVLSMFHFALRKDGFMFLGPSETIGKLTDLFEPVHHKWKIFRYIDSTKRDYSNMLRVQKTTRTEKQVGAKSFVPYQEANPSQKPLTPIYETILDQFASASLVVNHENEIVLTGGNVQKYAKLPIGNVTFNVLKLVPVNLSIAIGTALKKVRIEEEDEVSFDHIQLSPDEESEYVSLTVKPLTIGNDKSASLCVILINEEKPDSTIQAITEVRQYDHDQNIHQHIVDLENELAYTKETLQTMIEELETSNEEYQSTNEELIAANEELQSSNEELQSVNEELVNVNVEHQNKIKELTDLNNDIDNLLISTTIATVFLDEHLNIKRFTPEVTKLINLIEVDIGRPLAHLSHNLVYNQLIQDAENVLSTHHKKEKTVQSQDGRWYRLRLHPYRTKENFIRGVVITFLDITEMKELNETMKIQSFALEQSPASIMIVDQNGIVDYVNETYEKNMGLSRLDLKGTSIFDIYRNEQTKISLDESWKATKQGQRWDGTSLYVTRSGEERWEDVTFMPILNESYQIQQFLRVAEDITDKRNAENLLRKSEMLSALGEMAAGIAHEIRNPLTALKGFLQLMQADSASNQQYLGIMSNEFNRIELIINELLVLARPHAVTFEAGSVTTILKDVIMLLETQAIMNNIQLIHSFELELPDIECCDKELKQVFINIVRNAIEAMPDGGNIYISAGLVNEKVELTFRDEGKGIPKDRLEKIGEPFYTTKEKGTGLGMMVSYRIVQSHQGVMKFDSELGEGTTVTIQLPIKQ